MTFRVRLLPDAQRDAEEIYAWLWRQSVDGANRWYQAFLAAVHELGDDPLRHTAVTLRRSKRHDLYQSFFKTPKGRKYRLVFSVNADLVTVLRVRGPGQAPLKGRDLPVP
jgi:plasmid stabilization system protein ParE